MTWECVCAFTVPALSHGETREVRGFSSRSPYFRRSAPFIRCRCCIMQQTQKGPNSKNRAWTLQWQQRPGASEVTRTNFYKMHGFFQTFLCLFHNIVVSLVASLLLTCCLLMKENLFPVPLIFFLMFYLEILKLFYTSCFLSTFFPVRPDWSFV